MTTVAKNQEGQSVLEFLFMLPVMVGLVFLMLRINTAIQISIVDQQYARAQATWLTFNSPVFPEMKLRYAQLVGKNYNQMMIGVADNITPTDSSAYYPKATVQNVARTKAAGASGSNDPQVEPDSRALVRVRNTVSLCSQPNIVAMGVPVQVVSGLGDKQIPIGGPSNLTETVKFDYCKGPTL